MINADKLCEQLKNGNISFLLAVWGQGEVYYDGGFPCGFPNIMVGSSLILNHALCGKKEDAIWALERFLEICELPSFRNHPSFDVDQEFDLIHKNQVEITMSELRVKGYSFILIIPTIAEDEEFKFHTIYHFHEATTLRERICVTASELIIQTLDPEVCDFTEALTCTAEDLTETIKEEL